MRDSELTREFYEDKEGFEDEFDPATNTTPPLSEEFDDTDDTS